jgi:hypothetical protein
LRTVPFLRHSAVVSLLHLKDQIDVEDEKDDTVLGVSIETLTTAMAEVGNNWERVPLRHAECREGWEDALVGCLKDVSSDLHTLIIINIESVIACHLDEFPST